MKQRLNRRVHTIGDPLIFRGTKMDSEFITPFSRMTIAEFQTGTLFGSDYNVVYDIITWRLSNDN